MINDVQQKIKDGLIDTYWNSLAKPYESDTSTQIIDFMFEDNKQRHNLVKNKDFLNDFRKLLAETKELTFDQDLKYFLTTLEKDAKTHTKKMPKLLPDIERLTQLVQSLLVERTFFIGLIKGFIEQTQVMNNFVTGGVNGDRSKGEGFLNSLLHGASVSPAGTCQCQYCKLLPAGARGAAGPRPAGNHHTACQCNPCKSPTEFDITMTIDGRTPSFTDEISSFNPGPNGQFGGPQFRPINSTDVSMVSGLAGNTNNLDLIKQHRDLHQRQELVQIEVKWNEDSDDSGACEVDDQHEEVRQIRAGVKTTQITTQTKSAYVEPIKRFFKEKVAQKKKQNQAGNEHLDNSADNIKDDSKYQHLKEEKRHAENELQNLQKEFKAQNKAHQKIENQIDYKENNIIQLKQHIEKQSQELVQYRAVIEKFKVKCQQSMDKEGQSQAKVDDLEERLRRLQQETNEDSNQVDNFNIISEQKYDQMLGDLQSKIDILEEEKGKSIDKVHKLEGEVKQLRSSLKDFTQKNKELTLDNINLKEINLMLEDQNREQRSELAGANPDIERLGQNNDKLERENKYQQGEIAKLTLKIQDLEAELKALRAQLQADSQEQRDKIATAYAQSSEHEARATQLVHQLQANKTKQKEKIADLRGQNSAHESRATQLERDLSEEKAYRSKANAQSSANEVRVTELEHQLFQEKEYKLTKQQELDVVNEEPNFSDIVGGSSSDPEEEQSIQNQGREHTNMPFQPHPEEEVETPAVLPDNGSFGGLEQNPDDDDGGQSNYDYGDEKEEQKSDKMNFDQKKKYGQSQRSSLGSVKNSPIIFGDEQNEMTVDRRKDDQQHGHHSSQQSSQGSEKDKKVSFDFRDNRSEENNRQAITEYHNNVDDDIDDEDIELPDQSFEGLSQGDGRPGSGSSSSSKGNQDIMNFAMESYDRNSIKHPEPKRSIPESLIEDGDSSGVFDDLDTEDCPVIDGVNQSNEERKADREQARRQADLLPEERVEQAEMFTQSQVQKEQLSPMNQSQSKHRSRSTKVKIGEDQRTSDKPAEIEKKNSSRDSSKSSKSSSSSNKSSSSSEKKAPVRKRRGKGDRGNKRGGARQRGGRGQNAQDHSDSD